MSEVKKMQRQKLSIIELVERFPDEQSAEQWFINQRWSDGVVCPYCNGKRVSERTAAKKQWRCKECRKDFSIKTGTVMHSSNLPFKTWTHAIYLLTVNTTGIASAKLASDLKVCQATAWYLSMRLREAFDNDMVLKNTVEVDET